MGVYASKVIVVATVLSSTKGATDFVQLPTSLNISVGNKAVFLCQHSSANSITWKINNNFIHLSNVSQEISSSSRGAVYKLCINGSLEHNGLTITCVAMFILGSRNEETPAALLLVQSSLTDVGSLTRTGSTISWSSPYSIDLTNIEPDIVYSLSVFCITCGMMQRIIDVRDIVGNNYTSDLIKPHNIYAYNVTPISNEGVQTNRHSPLVTEHFSKVGLMTMKENRDDITVKVSFRYLEIDVPIPMFFTVILEAIDNLGDLRYNVTIDDMDEAIMLDLELNRLWNCTILAYDCEENIMLQGVKLSTHYIKSISVSSPHSGEIIVFGNHTDGSTTSGVLTIVYSLSNDSQVYYVVSHNLEDGEVIRLSGGEYGVSVFDIGESGLPFERAATTTSIISVDDSHSRVDEVGFIEYEVHGTVNSVCVTCTFLDSSTTYCVAVVHRRISQLSSSGLMNIESSHKFNRSGDTAYGCIEGVNQELFKIGVAGGKMIMELNTLKEEPPPTAANAAGTALGVLALAAMVVVVIVVLIVRMKRNHKTEHDIVVDLVVSVRVIDDGGHVATPPVTESADQQTITSPHQVTSDNGAGDPTYAPELTMPQPTATEKVSYEDGQALKNQQLLVSNGGATDDHVACLQKVVLYMKRSDLDHSWEESEAAIQKIIKSSSVSASVQEVSPLEDSPKIGGSTIHVPNTHATGADHENDLPSSQSQSGRISQSQTGKDPDSKADSAYVSTEAEHDYQLAIESCCNTPTRTSTLATVYEHGHNVDKDSQFRSHGVLVEVSGGGSLCTLERSDREL